MIADQSTDTMTAAEAVQGIAKHFVTDTATATRAFQSAHSFLKLEWDILDRAEYQQVIDTIHNVTGLGGED